MTVRFVTYACTAYLYLPQHARIDSNPAHWFPLTVLGPADPTPEQYREIGSRAVAKAARMAGEQAKHYRIGVAVNRNTPAAIWNTPRDYCRDIEASAHDHRHA
jgi:hypothetical protein